MDTYIVTYPNGNTTRVTGDELIKMKPSLLLIGADWEREKK